MGGMALTARLPIRPTDSTHRVTTLELFFDVVFVFALTQVTAYLADNTTALGALRSVVVLALLWWAWCSYAWLGNQARADEGLIRLAVIVAMGGVFVLALAIPEVYSDRSGGLPAAVVFVVAYAFLRTLHALVYVVAAGSDTELRRTVLLTYATTTIACLVLLAGALIGPPWQTLLWAAALVIDYVGVFVTSRTNGWRLPSPRHFAERHGLIVIIALGESIVAIGVGAGELPLSTAVLLAAVLGLAVATALWWMYFDVVALVAEEVLAERQGVERSRLARDSFTYLHFPMITGIVFLALGLKKVLEYVADTDAHELADPLTGLAALALFGGPALYLLAHIAFRLRNLGSINVPRLVVALVLLALVPLVQPVPALMSLALLAVLLGGLVGYEVVRYHEAREAIRHREHGTSA